MEEDYGQFAYLDSYERSKTGNKNTYLEIEGMQTAGSIDNISKKINELTRQQVFIFGRIALLLGLIILSGASGLYIIFTL